MTEKEYYEMHECKRRLADLESALNAINLQMWEMYARVLQRYNELQVKFYG